MVRVVRRALRVGRQPLAGWLLIIVSSWCLASTLATPAGAALGRWSPRNPTSPDTFDFQQIHMVLLPGDGIPYHSRILTWEEVNSTEGAELGWNDGLSDCTNAPYTLPVIGSWNPGAGIFCGGHSHLLVGAKTELLSVGGHSFSAPLTIP